MPFKIKKYFKYLLLLIYFSANIAIGQEEDIRDFEYNPKSKFGLRFGLGVSRINGGNFKNPRPYLGYAAGFFHHFRLKNRHYLYYETALRFQGGNFRTNPDSLTYSKISLFYVGLPVSYMYRLGNDEKKPFFLMAGGGGSLLVKSSMLLGPNPIPTYFDLPLKRGDLFLSTGFYKFFGSVGLQFSTKVGLTNINKNNWTGFEKVKPSPNQGLPVKNISFEFGLIF